MVSVVTAVGGDEVQALGLVVSPNPHALGGLRAEEELGVQGYPPLELWVGQSARARFQKEGQFS